MENPHVDCIGHLTGRKINKRAPMDVDLERVFATGGRDRHRGRDQLAARPSRSPRRATPASRGERGVRIAVSTDAHSTSALGYLPLGIGQARRAWLTKEQVVNTRPWSKVKK